MAARVAHVDVGGPGAVATPASTRRRILQDSVAGAVLLAGIPVVHDVKTTLTAPYWLDEAWVALSVRFPLGDLPVTTSSTPLGWSLLLRLVPDSDYLRVVPLAFHGLAVVAAYAFGRLLRSSTRGRSIAAGVVCATAVLLLPAQQVRHDLKQYTADAAVTIGLLALAAWTEQAWSRTRLGMITAAVAVGMLLSHVTAIAASCVFGGFLLVTAIRRQWLRLVEAALAGLVALMIVAAVYFGISARSRSEAMQQWWAASFPGLTELPGYLRQQIGALIPLVGAPGLVVVGLLVAGSLTLVKWGRPVCAIAVILLPASAITLAVARIYPLLELRTSHFLLVAAAAVAGIGVSGLANLAASRARRVLPRVEHTIVTAAICVMVLGAFAVKNGRWYRFDGNEPGLYYTAIAVTDIRSATQYVATHRSPNDVIVMNNTAWYGFAFYSKRDAIELITPYGNTVGWWVGMPTRSDVVVVPNSDTTAISAGLDRALEMVRRRGVGARVWLIRSHIIENEVADWRSVLAGYRVELVTGGVEPVALLSKG